MPRGYQHGKSREVDSTRTGELRPDLGEDTDVSSVDHVWLEKLQVRNIGISTLKFAHVFDLLEFLEDERRVTVAFGVNESEDSVTLFPTILRTASTSCSFEC